ncbi:MAG: hypothetical protein AAGA91_01515 [Pseudomonadota bacterium]
MNIGKGFCVVSLVTGLVACGGTGEVRPDQDPLVIARFEHYLKHNGIAYQRNLDGSYSPMDPRMLGEMEDLEYEASDIEYGRSRVKADDGCALDMLEDYLSENDVIYVNVQGADGNYLEMTQQDYNAHRVSDEVHDFKKACRDKEHQKLQSVSA